MKSKRKELQSEYYSPCFLICRFEEFKLNMKDPVKFTDIEATF